MHQNPSSFLTANCQDLLLLRIKKTKPLDSCIKQYGESHQPENKQLQKQNKTKQNINPGENVFQGEGSVRSRRDPHGVPEWESSAKELEMGTVGVGPEIYNKRHVTDLTLQVWSAGPRRR